MNTKSKTAKILSIITGIGAVVYLIVIVNAFFQGELSFSKLVDIYSLILLLVFLAGFVLSWKRKKLAGIILMIWNAGIWLWDLYLIGDLSDTDSGMASMVLSPVMVLGALILLEWYKTSKVPVPSVKQRWKFVLRTLLINYAVLYFILVFAELSGTTGAKVDYSVLPHILNPPLLLIFIAGFVVSWKRETLAGIIFLIWCGLVIFDFFGFPGTYYSGPWGFCILPILLQAIFYIRNHYEFRPKQKFKSV